MEEKCYTVYMHICPNGKRYIGITKLKPQERWGNGKSYKGCVLFNKAIQKYSWQNIKHEILFEHLSKQEAENKEIELIAYYKSNQKEYGYNIANGGNCVGSVSDETKKKISIRTKEAMSNPEIRKKLSIAQHNRISPLKGRKLSEEHKRKLKEASRKSMLGRHHSEETKQKIREKALGRKLSEEAKEKIRIANKNRIISKETREKISKAQKGHIGYNKGHISPKRKKVLCIETNTIYDSLMIAGKETNISIGHISQCCNNVYGRKTAGGYHWQYYNIDKVESEEK